MSAAGEVRVPDIGDFKNIPIIQIMVAPGDVVRVEDALVTLESDKATIDIPAPVAGRVLELKVNTGDRVSRGTLLLILDKALAQPAQGLLIGEVAESVQSLVGSGTLHLPRLNPESAGVAAATVSEISSAPRSLGDGLNFSPSKAFGTDVPTVRAGPSVRGLARRLGVSLADVKGSGPKARVLREDVQAFVKAALLERNSPAAAPTKGAGAAPLTSVDFSRFGLIERRAMSRIQKVSGPRLARSWTVIPHVTNFDDADVTELESFRVQLNKERAQTGAKLTMLSFLIKACALALGRHERINASIDGEEVVFKKYFHIGFAADTPEGLLVPVIRDADKKGIGEIAQEAVVLAAKARENKLKSGDLEGGCFTVSSLGGIGGSGFTPLINAPEIAILGAAKSRLEPRWNGECFIPRLILPLSLSWDHRAVDGAIAARFLSDIVALLQDLRRAVI